MRRHRLLEACIREGQQGHQGTCKKRGEDYSTSRPPLSKKGNSRMFELYKKNGALMVPFHQQPSRRMMGGQTPSRADSSGGTGERKNVN